MVISFNMKTTTITELYEKRSIEGIRSVSPKDMMGASGEVLLVEPVFFRFSNAQDQQLGFPFIVLEALKGKFKRITFFLSYSQENAITFKGYVLDLKNALQHSFPHVTVEHVPYVSKGSPISGSVLVLSGSVEPYKSKDVEKPVMPSEYIPDLLAHIPRNREGFLVTASSSFLGMVRSDLELLPPIQQWQDRSLLVEYRDGNSSKIRRMRIEDVGRLFGVVPRTFGPDMRLCVPSDVLKAYAG